MKKLINKQLLPMKAHYFLWNAGTGPVVPYLSSYARQLGFSSVIVGLIYTILPISGMLAKPIFGSIADRFRCQKSIFLAAQLLTAIMFLSIFYSPKIEVNRQVQLTCYNNIPAFNTHSNNLNECKIQQIHEDESVGYCRMVCMKTRNLTSVLCTQWNIERYCDSFDNSSTVIFDVEVPKTHINLFEKKLIFGISGMGIENSTFNNPRCPENESISTSCSIECDNYDFNEMITSQSISDQDAYNMYQFWCFLFFMLMGWVGQAIVVSIGDAICFELLGDKPNKYGYQRMFGALGWGIFSAVAGIIIDVFSQGKSQKDYTSAFYLSFSLLVLDFVISAKIKYKQTKISSNICRDVGRLLLNIRIVVYLIWCIAVGMCTGLIWNFLFWLLEDLAAASSCETQNYIKTLQGLVQAVECIAGEVPFFFLSGRILKRLGHINTMSLVLFALGCRLTLYSVIINPWLILPVELLNGLTFGLFFACMASYASIVAPPGTEATMQGLVGAVFEGVGVSSGSTLAGISYQKYGGAVTFRYFGIGSFSLCLVHVIVQYLLTLKDTTTQYSPPQDILEKVQEEDQRELTFIDS